MLEPNIPNLSPKLLFQIISFAASSLASLGYARHFSQLRDTTVWLPPVSEREKILEILSDCDAAIETLREIFVRKSKLFENLPQYFSRELSSIESVRLGEISSVEMGQSPPASSYNDDGIGVPLAGGGDDINDGMVSPARYTSQATKMASKGSVLMTVRAPVGDVAVAGRDLCIGRGFCVIKPNEDSSRDFIRHSLTALKGKWKRVEQGSTFSAVDKASVLDFVLPYPSSKGDLEKLVAVLQEAQSEIDKVKCQLSLLQQQKRGLMQQLLTGKLRVGEAA